MDLVERLEVADRMVANGAYLDIGSGTGHITVGMALAGERKSARCIGLEPVSKPTGRVKKRIQRRSAVNVNFARAIGNELPLRENSVDGVSMFFVLHHIPLEIQNLVFDEIQRVMKPGGLFFLWEDTPENDEEYEYHERQDRRLNFEAKSEPHFYRKGDEWDTVFQNRGFELIHKAYFDEPYYKDKSLPVRHTGYVFEWGG